MPTIFSVAGYRIVVYFNDHPPPHVHVLGDGEARFFLGSAPEEVRLLEKRDIKEGDLRSIAEAIIDRHDQCLREWRKHHGNP